MGDVNVELVSAVIENDLDQVNLLLKKNADPNCLTLKLVIVCFI